MKSAETFLQLEYPDCVLCGHDRFSVIHSRVTDLAGNVPGEFQIQRCRRCGLLHTRPRPAPESLFAYYRNANMRRTEVTRLDEMFNRHRLKVLQRARPLSSRDKVLDIGCGTGSFLFIARRETGCQVCGVEFDPEVVDNAVEPDTIEYHVGEIEGVDLPEGHYQVVSFYQSLEHHPDPLTAVKKAHALLAPGGVCVVEVPDYGSWLRPFFGTFWFPLLIPQHLVHFESDTLTKMVNAAGFEDILLSESTGYPTEIFLSSILWLWDRLDIPRLHMPKNWRSGLIPFVLGVAGMGIAPEIPLQLLLQRMGRSGHRTLIARKH